MKNFLSRITGREARQQRAEIAALKKDLNYKVALIDDYQRQIAKANSSVNVLRAAERLFKENEAELKGLVKKRSGELDMLKKNLETAAQANRHAETVIEKAEKNITDLTAELQRRTDQFNDLVKTNSNLSREIAEKERLMKLMTEKLNALQGNPQVPARSSKLKSLKTAK